MDNNLNVRKLYIDTRYKLDPNGSNTKFTIEFPQTIECPENTVMFVDEIVLPNTITTVQQDVNDRVYLVVKYNNSLHYFNAQLPEKNYTLPSFAEELKGQLNLQILFQAQSAAVEVTTVYDINDLTVSLTVLDKRAIKVDTMEWLILSDDALKQGFFNATQIKEPNSCNDILQNYVVDFNGIWNQVNKAIKYRVDLHTTRNLYLLADIGEFRTITNFPWSGSSVLKKIQMNVPYSDTLLFNVIMPYDCTHVGNMSFNRLQFHLVNSKGNYPNLRNNWSFSLIFERQ